MCRMPSTTSHLPTSSTHSSPLWSLDPPGVVAPIAFPGPTALAVPVTMRRLCCSALMMSSKCGPWWGRKGVSSSLQPGWGAASTTLLLPFYLLDQKQLAYRFQRNRPQECVYMANPALSGARAEDTGCSYHTSAAHPVLGTRLEPAIPGSKCLCFG